MENLLKISADETRLRILLCLLDGSSLTVSPEKCVNDIVKETGKSQSLVSHQLKVLKDNCLVVARKEGTKTFYQLSDDHVRQILDVAYAHVLEQEEARENEK